MLIFLNVGAKCIIRRNDMLSFSEIKLHFSSDFRIKLLDRNYNLNNSILILYSDIHHYLQIKLLFTCQIIAYILYHYCHHYSQYQLSLFTYSNCNV